MIDVPTDIGVPSKGRDSIERVKQEEREQTALGALYLTATDLPDSPAEPDFQIPEEQVDAEVKSMLAGPADEVFWTGDAPAALAVSSFVLSSRILANPESSNSRSSRSESRSGVASPFFDCAAW